MAMGDPNAPDVNERKRKMALPKRNPRRKVNTTAMPTVLPKPIALRKSPEELMARDRANEFASAMKGANYNKTPAAPLRDFQRAMPDMVPTKQGGPSPAQLATDANLEKYRQERMGEQPNTFAAFLKSMGMGK